MPLAVSRRRRSHTRLRSFPLLLLHRLRCGIIEPTDQNNDTVFRLLNVRILFCCQLLPVSRFQEYSLEGGNDFSPIHA